MPVKVYRLDGTVVETGRLTKLLSFRGLERVVAVEEVSAGDIIAVAGLTDATVPETIGSPDLPGPLPATPIDPPTLSMTFRINDGPLAGREGKKVTSRQIRERLMAEAEGNVAIHVAISNETDAFEVAGRGELQLGVLIEQMRREGFELTIGRPKVLTRPNPENRRARGALRGHPDRRRRALHGRSGRQNVSAGKGELSDIRPSGGGQTTPHLPHPLYAA